MSNDIYSMSFRSYLMMEEVLTDAKLIQIAKEVKKVLAMGGSQPALGDHLYHVLTNQFAGSRPTVDPSDARDWSSRVMALRFGDRVHAKQGYSWLSVDAATPRREKTKLDYYAIQYKKYVSISPEKDNLDRFLAAIPDLAERYADLSEKLGDDIEFKIPMRLDLVLSHPDPLVIYYKDQKNGEPVLNTVRRWVVDHRISTVSRGARGHSGYDLYPDQGDPKSHTQLVTNWIASQIITHDNAVFQMSDDELARWLRGQFVHASIVKPDDMFNKTVFY